MHEKAFVNHKNFDIKIGGQFADDLFFAMRKRRKQNLPPER